MISNKKECVLVFDLDDTLYSEYDYQTSGYLAISNFVKELFKVDPYKKLLTWRDAKESDIFAKLCKYYSLPMSLKTSLLWIYRLHSPNISLTEEVKYTLRRCENEFKNTLILTDGRSSTQRLKLKRLGLDYIPTFISEDYGSEKPNVMRFEIIMNNYPADSYLYVADNPLKDFIAPNQLGWMSACLIGTEKNIHKQRLDGLPRTHLPTFKIDSLAQILN